MTDEGNITDAGLEALAEALAVQLFRWRDIDIPARLLTDPIREALAASRVHPAGEPVAWTRDDMAEGLAHLDNVLLSAMTLTADWREYRARADDLMAQLSLAYASPAPSYADCLDAARKVAIQQDNDHGAANSGGAEAVIAALEALTPGSPL